MTAEHFLSQARFLDHRINAKLAQVSVLNDLAHKCTATWNDMPRNPNGGGSAMAKAIDRIIDLENEINADIDKLVDLKAEIVAVIKSVDNPEYQVLLELRYLCLYTWEQIAVNMHYSGRWIRHLHEEALCDVERVLNS